MTIRRLVVVTASLFLLAAAPACSGPDDPSGDTGSGGGGEDTGVTDTGGDEDTGTPDEDTGTPDDDTGMAEDTMTGGDTGGDTSDGGGGGGGWDPVDNCSVLTDFTGEINSDSAGHGGGQPASSSDVLPADAGLDQVWTWMKDNRSKAEGGTTEFGDTTLEISGATVVATEPIAENLGNQRFYIQDQNRTLYVRLSEQPTLEEPNADTAKINVGDQVSFTVKKVNLYQGETPQISNTGTITIDSADNEVPIYSQENLGGDSYGKIFRIGGRLKNKSKCDSPMTSCGEERCNYCYDLMNKDGSKVVTFRSATETAGSKKGFPDGACVTFVGPVGMFPGPLAKDAGAKADRLQIQDTNFKDWLLQARNAQ